MKFSQRTLAGVYGNHCCSSDIRDQEYDEVILDATQILVPTPLILNYVDELYEFLIFKVGTDSRHILCE
jgi:hypothetical protein